MAGIDDVFSTGNIVTGAVVAAGLYVGAPLLRPIAKLAIKGGILAYRGAMGLVTGTAAAVSDLAAEATHELDASGSTIERVESWGTATPPSVPVGENTEESCADPTPWRVAFYPARRVNSGRWLTSPCRTVI